MLLQQGPSFTKGDSEGNSNSEDMRKLGEEPDTFLQFAEVDRFSMCLTDADEGVLRLNTPKTTDEMLLGSVGKLHWGVDFRGISVGDIHADVVVCTGDNMQPFQETPCAAIPDSGTTLISAPEWQLEQLFTTICDKWDRCRNNYTRFMEAQEKVEDLAEDLLNGTVPWDIFNTSKAQTFQSILHDCDSWLTEEDTLDAELPELHFHVRGSEGRNQTLSLRGWAYVMEVTQEGSTDQQKKAGQPGDIFVASPDAAVLRPTAGRADQKEADMESIPMELPPDPFTAGTSPKRACQAAFGTMDYSTSINGPVWILGTSFFYDYDITFNLGSEPPSMAFRELKEEGCGTCRSQSPASLGQTVAGKSSSARKSPRRVNGTPRRSQIKPATHL